MVGGGVVDVSVDDFDVTFGLVCAGGSGSGSKERPGSRYSLSRRILCMRVSSKDLDIVPLDECSA